MSISIGSNSAISQLFSKLDTKKQGYLDQSDLTAAFSQISSGNSSTTAQDVFSALDTDSDGKVTESEFSSTLSKLQEQLDSQFGQMRMHGHGGQGPQGMAPPPPPKDDAGFTQDELTQQLQQIGSSDSKRSDFISNIVNNFSAADSNGDGKVSGAEARAFNESSSTSSDSSSSTSGSKQASSSDSERQLMMQIMRLMAAYRSDTNNETASALSSSLSVTA